MGVFEYRVSFGTPNVDAGSGTGITRAQVDSVSLTDSLTAVWNQAPIARLTPDAAIQVGTAFDLYAATSEDPDGGTVSLSWAIDSQPVGSAVSLVAAVDAASATAPTDNHKTLTATHNGAYVVTVTATDSTGLTGTRTRTYTASGAAPGGGGGTGGVESRLLSNVWNWALDDASPYVPIGGTGFDESYLAATSVVDETPNNVVDTGKALKVRFPINESGIQHSNFVGHGIARRRRFTDLGITPRRTLYFRYCVYLPSNWLPYDGGKLPSLMSHPADRPLFGATGMSSGNIYADDSWWAGMMWVGPSQLTGYGGTYKADSNVDHIRFQCYVYAKQIQGITYTSANVSPSNGLRGYIVRLRSGLSSDITATPTSSGTGSGGLMYFNRGAWNTVEQLVTINDVGVANGQLVMWLNGELGLNIKNIKWAADTYNSSAIINGLMLDTFYGGPTSNSTDQLLYLDDFTLSTSYNGPRAGS